MQAQERMPVRYGQGRAGETSATLTAGSPRWEYAGFWRRFAAWFIDTICESIAGFVVVFVVFLAFIPPEVYEDPVLFDGVAALVGWVVGIPVHWLY